MQIPFTVPFSMRATPQERFEGRPVCYRCNKPELTCICGHLRSVANRTPIWVAQHPRERFHPIGTARIARLGLDDVHVEVVPPRTTAPASLPAAAGLLYPGPHARELATLPSHQRPRALVVIDGTWAHARTLYRDNPWLRSLPHYRLTPRHESRYRLRKEPAAGCVSTIEAIVEALRILEPETVGLDGLLASFDRMIDEQLALIERRHNGPRRRNVARTRQGVPHCIVDEIDRLVVVGFETAPRGRSKRTAPAIVHCVAQRVTTGEVFQHFVKPPPGQFPTPCHLEQMGLDASQLQDGAALSDLRDAWLRFVERDDIVVAWNQSVLDVVDVTLGITERRVHLKSAYRSRAKQVRGPLASLVEQLGLERVARPPLCGRAGAHLADVVALVKHLARAA